MIRHAAMTMTIVLGALTAACGSDDDAVAPDETSVEESSAGFNEADVAFAQGMIPHHEQAVEMAALAAERTESDGVRDLASRIEAGQDPEIEVMRRWLEGWDEPVDGAGMEMGEGAEMDGMMSDDDIQALEDAEGAEFDGLFLEMMVEHHRGAVRMAETALVEGESPDALELAQEVIDTQTAEIEEIEEMLAG